MKKKVCMILSVMLALGNMPVYGAERHDLTAKVGTLEFYKDNVLYPLDTEIYIKDGYVMLPLRAFLTAIEGDEMHWEQAEKLAWVQIGTYVVAVDLENRRIMVNGEEIAFIGEMEVRNGRTFLPLRNWKTLLNACGYTVNEQDILWDTETKTAKLCFSKEDKKPKEPSLLTGEGVRAEYTLPLSNTYDNIQNVGAGLFIGQKVIEQDPDRPYDLWGERSVYVLMDSSGKEFFCTVDEMYASEDMGNGTFLLKGWEMDRVIDRSGTILFTSPDDIQSVFSEGLAAYREDAGEKMYYGYIDETGNIVIPAIYEGAERFSEGLAAVCVRYNSLLTETGYKVIGEYGYIDKNGKMVIEPIYERAESFSEGLAAVKTKNGWGFVDCSGTVVIQPQYAWVTDFVNGTAFAMEEEGLRTWLIGPTGEKLKLIMEGEEMVVLEHTEEIIFLPPFSGWCSDDDATGGRYFDKTGEISQQEVWIRNTLSEGLAAIRDMEANKMFYVNENGKQMISDTFDKAEAFKDGYAVVVNKRILENGKTDEEWGIIRHPMQ